MKNILLLDGKKAAVTGASKGIGAAIALALAEAGADVMLISRDEGKMASVVSRIEKLGVKAKAICMDVSVPAQTARFEEYIRDFGGIDFYVNNAAYTVHKSAMETSDEEAHALFETNYFGAMALAKAAARHMLFENKSGAITFVTSINAIGALPNQAVYSCTKAALESLVRSLAAELSPHGIRVNSVAPGAIYTDMNSQWTPFDITDLEGKTPLRRIGTPNEIANIVLFLCSDAAGFMTGSTVVADGGLLLRGMKQKNAK